MKRGEGIPGDGAQIEDIARSMRLPTSTVKATLRGVLVKLARSRTLRELRHEQPTAHVARRVSEAVTKSAQADDDSDDEGEPEPPRITALSAIFDPDVDDVTACEKIWGIYLRNSGPRNDGGAP